MDTIETYIDSSQNTIDQYIATGTILDLYQEAERHMGAKVPKWKVARATEAVVKEI